MSEVINPIGLFEGVINLITMIIFIVGASVTLLIYWRKKTVSSILIFLLMVGGLLNSIGEIIYEFKIWDIHHDFVETIVIFLASILLITGLVVMLEQKLKESQEVFLHLFENSPNSIFILSSKGRIIDCNSETEKLFRCKKDDLINKNIKKTSKYLFELSSILNERLKTIFDEDSKSPLELQLFKKKDTSVWVSLQISLYELGGETFVQIVIQDITERKKAENIIRKEIEKLKEIDQMRSDLVRRTSHELKTPLISIYSASQYLLDSCKEEMNEEVLKFVKNINRGGIRLKSLTQNLLDVYDIESRVLKLKKRKENLTEIINECINDLNLFIKERELLTKVDLDGDFHLEIEKVRIEQVILNILSNAIKNTPPKGIIYINLQKSNDYMDIIIKDTGVGFTEEEKEKIFKKFGKIERTIEDMKIDTEGSGLGLYISKEIVELHDGKIWVESEGRNKGSTFIVRLPRYSKS